MLFTSFAFVIFCVTVLGLYSVIPKRGRAVLLLAASYFFYSQANIQHLAILLVDTTIAYGFGRVLERKRRRYITGLGVSALAMPLLLFKYAGFLSGMASELGVGFGTWRAGLTGLPIGTSFYTLQAISYLLDVNRRRTKAIPDFATCALYLAYFPQILAGPIERSGRLTPQLESLRPLSGRNLYLGAKICLWGYFCKLILADKAGLIVAFVFGNAQHVATIQLISGLYLYSFQIYFDFFGYTLIATGLARMFGITLSRNFNTPYLSTSLRTFWRRWHITLMTWFRDYVYIPSGGRGHGLWRFCGSVVVVFLLSGLWHGASVNFVAWGCVHAMGYLAAEGIGRASVWWRPKLPWRFLARWLGWAITFTFVSLTWSLFVRDDYAVWDVLWSRISTGNWSPGGGYSWDGQGLVLAYLCVLLVFFCLDSVRAMERMTRIVPRNVYDTIREIALVNVMLVCIILFGDFGTREFIYFRF